MYKYYFYVTLPFHYGLWSFMPTSFVFHHGYRPEGLLTMIGGLLRLGLKLHNLLYFYFPYKKPLKKEFI